MRRPDYHPFHEALILLLLAGACYVFFFHGLSNIGLLGPDEPRYASVAREMYLMRDYVTPYLHGVPWFEKPPLLYWCVTAGFALFGIGEFAARLPSAVAATLTVFFTYIVCRKLWGRAVAVWASLILASSAGFFAFARAASTDMLLTSCLTAALLSFMMGNNSKGPGRRWWFLAFYAFLGLGFLAKGPVAIILPALSLAAYLLFRGRRSEWKEWCPGFALITLAVAAPWHIAVTQANGFEFIRVFFINHNFERFTSTVHGHERPFYYYIPALVGLTFPWTFALLPALRRTLDRTDQVLLCFSVVPILFFSLAGSKLPGYILPTIPPIAMLCARVIVNKTTGLFRIAVFLEAGLVLLIGVAVGLFGSSLDVDPHVSGWIIIAVAIPMAVTLVIIGRWLNPAILAGFNGLAMGLIVLAATNFVVPRFETTDTMRPWQRVLEEIIVDGQTVFLYKPARWMEYGMQYYWPDKAQGVFTPEQLDAALKAGPKVLFIADDNGLADLSAVSGIEVEITKTLGTQSAFWAWRPK
jgi:4-amino-4-deoxy-L-arabinose transferase-like glycosyltransferase